MSHLEKKATFIFARITINLTDTHLVILHAKNVYTKYSLNINSRCELKIKIDPREKRNSAPKRQVWNHKIERPNI